MFCRVDCIIGEERRASTAGRGTAYNATARRSQERGNWKKGGVVGKQKAGCVHEMRVEAHCRVLQVMLGTLAFHLREGRHY